MKPRMLLLILSGLLATGQPAIAQRAQGIVTEENLRAFLIWAKQNPTKELQAARRGRIGRTFTSQEIEDRWIQDRMPVIWARAQTPEQQGHIGLLNFGRTIYRVVQVQDENNAIMRATVRVLNIYSTYVPPREWDFWLTSPLVATFRDGQEFEGEGMGRGGIPGVFKVAGAKTYTTTLGAKRTIDLIVSVDLTKYMKPQENQPQEKPPRSRPTRPFRTWTDATGEHKTEARFHSYGMGRVTIEKKDGEKVQLSMQRLSEADQAWVREHIGKR